MHNGFFECTSSLVVEVCSAIIPGSLVANVTSILDRLFDYDYPQSPEEFHLCWSNAALSGLSRRWWNLLSSPRSNLQFRDRRNHE